MMAYAYLLKLRKRKARYDFQKFVTVGIEGLAGELAKSLQIQTTEIVASMFYLKAVVQETLAFCISEQETA